MIPRVIKSIFLIFALIGLSACGGGGGGSGGGDSSSGSSSSSSGGTACINPTIDDKSLPAASITFPWKVSRTDGNSVVVRGTATDASGIQSVVVNGVEASVTCSSNATASQFKYKPAAIGDDNGVTWEAVVPLPAHATTDIVVEVTDGAGNTNANADQVQITNQRAPTFFVFDSLNHRLFSQFGSSFGYLDVLTSEVTAVPLMTSEGIDMPAPEGYYQGATLVGSTLYTASIYAGQAEVPLYSSDLNSGLVSELGQIDLDLPDGMWAWIGDLVYDNGHLYLLVKFFSDSDDSYQTHIFQYALASGASSRLSDSEDVTQGEPLDSREMEVGDGELLVTLSDEFGGGDMIIGVSLTDGVRSLISDPTGIVFAKLVYDSVADITYAVGFDGVAKVDMSSGTSTNISPEADQDYFNFTQVRSAVLDKGGNRLLVGDDGLDMILSIDLTTGIRSKLFGNGVGEGHPLIAPRGFVMDPENNRVYVVDDGGNAPEAIFAIDLETGDRTQVSDIEQEFNIIIPDIVLDAQHHRLLVALRDEILSVDLGTEVVTTFSGGGTPVGEGVMFEDITGMALDAGGQKLLVTDGLVDALVAVDLGTGDRTVFSQAGTKGLGDPLDGPSGITVDATTNTAFVASQLLATVFRINLETGDRTVIPTECEGISDTGLRNLAFNAATGDLWMYSTNMLRHNINDGSCQAFGTFLDTYFDMAFTEEGQLLVTSFNKLVQFDTVTGKAVIISK